MPDPGADLNSYAIRVWNCASTYHQLSTPTVQQKIDGGTIQVRPEFNLERQEVRGGATGAPHSSGFYPLRGARVDGRMW
jgi:hypothetical protein